MTAVDPRAKSALDQFEHMKVERLPFERIWQEVSDYVLPRRDFSITAQPGQLRTRRVTSNVAPNACNRMAALVLAWALDPTRPFLLPNVKRGLVAAGRSTDLSSDAQDYLGDLEWSVYDHMMLPKARLVLELGMAIREWCAFGGQVVWAGRKRGFGPTFRARPVQACWWSMNDDGEIDTLAYRMALPISKVIGRWPQAEQLIQGWDQKRDSRDLVHVLHMVRPRPGGVAGRARLAKPFEELVIVEEDKTVIDEGGFDSFPFAVSLYDPIPGQAYSFGPGAMALPDTKVLNHFIGALERSAELKADPPKAMPARMFGKKLDMRPAAMNIYNAMALGLQRPDQAILKLDLGGDVTVAQELIQYLTSNIELVFFTDWMRDNDGANVTAEWVIERRDIRLRGMSSIVANLSPAMGVLGDRTMAIMAEEGLIAAPPAELHAAEVDWAYAGPLAVAQLRGQAESVNRLMSARQLVAAQDPAAAEAVDLAEGLRVLAESLGAPTRLMNSREHVATARAKSAQQSDQLHASKVAQQAGQGMSGVGAGLSSMADAGSTIADASPPPGQAGAPLALPAPANAPGPAGPLPMAA